MKSVSNNVNASGFSVIMPTYNHANFIRRAIVSLLNQTYCEWELIIVNDGSNDNTEAYIQDFLANENRTRIKYTKSRFNNGLGSAINQGLDMAKYGHIAYLPADDYYHSNHLELLMREFEKSDSVILAYSYAKNGYKDSVTKESLASTNGLFDHHSLQLVQTAHRKTDDRWLTRNEWVTDNLFEMFWHKLVSKGLFVSTYEQTAYWTPHPYQRHKIINENYGGGLNIYRQYYGVKDPIKLKINNSKFINEDELYSEFRKPSEKKYDNNPLKILIVGELAYNPERIYALQEYGHQLYGLWMEEPTFSFSTVGHLPFGNVIDIPYDGWEEQVNKIKPDIIYATLNFGAIPLAYEVMKRDLGIPFVWHFKEGPFICLKNGIWNKLIELYNNADGKIYICPEIKLWYEQFITNTGLSFILDGDLPKIEYFTEDFSTRLSENDGSIHTVIPGRAIGITPEDIKILAKNNTHVHLYVENYSAIRTTYIKSALRLAPGFFHVHPHCSPDHWVKEFSQYDAGWLHCFDSKNEGNITDATWDDLNMPARMNTLAAAGLPMIQKSNQNHIVAMHSHAQKHGVGIFFDTYDELSEKLKDSNIMFRLQGEARRNKHKFCFDYYVPELINFFRKVIQKKLG